MATKRQRVSTQRRKCASFANSSEQAEVNALHALEGKSEKEKYIIILTIRDAVMAKSTEILEDDGK